MLWEYEFREDLYERISEQENENFIALRNAVRVAITLNFDVIMASVTSGYALEVGENAAPSIISPS